MGTNRSGRRRTQRLKRNKRHQAQLLRKALAGQNKETTSAARS